MKKNTTRFQVDSRLAKLLSQEYTSSERALKELVDNAWDADAECVDIQLPEPMSDAPIVIRDDGTGMTGGDPKKLRQVLLHEYGRATDFRIAIDGKSLGVDDVDGTYTSEVLQVDGVGEVRLDFAIAESKAVTKQPGLVIKVDGKVVGKGPQQRLG